jgi:DNA-binding winged helix-turn-helix (wHTH) protein
VNHPTIYHLSATCRFDRENHSLVDASDQVFHKLTKLQFAVLDLLFRNRGDTVEYMNIIQEVWESNDVELRRNLSEIICDLRKVLERITPSLRECIQTKRDIGLMFLCDYPQPIEKVSKPIRLLSSREYDRDALNIATQLVKNDYSLYGDLGENEGEASTWASFIRAYPDTFHLALNEDDEIVGNWSFCAPQDDQLELIQKGQVKEAYFSLNNSNYINFPAHEGYYDGFILNFSLNRHYRTAVNEHMLFNSFVNQLLEWAKLGIYFRYIYVNVFIDEQEQMYGNFGFLKLCENHPNGKIYKLNLLDFPQNPIWSRYEELRKLYVDFFSSNQ